MVTNCVALMQAVKHEEQPTAMKLGKSGKKYKETIDFVGSASAWDKFTLTRFGVDFDPIMETPLTNLIIDQRYYDPADSSPRFVERTSLRNEDLL